MLAPKRLNPKKMIIYGIVLILLFGGTGFVLYKNLFAGKKGSSPPAMTAGEGIDDIQDIKVGPGEQYSEDELKFLKSSKFKKLRSNVEELKIEEVGNKNPFRAGQ